MLLLLQGAHYDLALPEVSILERFTPQEKESEKTDGYNAEEEDDEDPTTTAPKSPSWGPRPADPTPPDPPDHLIRVLRPSHSPWTPRTLLAGLAFLVLSFLAF